MFLEDRIKSMMSLEPFFSWLQSKLLAKDMERELIFGHLES